MTNPYPGDPSASPNYWQKKLDATSAWNLAAMQYASQLDPRTAEAFNYWATEAHPEDQFVKDFMAGKAPDPFTRFREAPGWLANGEQSDGYKTQNLNFVDPKAVEPKAQANQKANPQDPLLRGPGTPGASTPSWLHEPDSQKLMQHMATFAAQLLTQLNQSGTQAQGDYWPGQAQGRPNPLAQPIPSGESIPYETDLGGKAPAPYGYTDSGHVKLGPDQTDANATGGISQFAPNRASGPTNLPDRQTEANPGAPTGTAGAFRSRAE